MPREKREKKILTMPVLAVRGIVLFPGAVIQFDVARGSQSIALKAASNPDRQVFITAGCDQSSETPDETQFFDIGVIAKVRQTFKNDGGGLRVLVEGEFRARAIRFFEEGGISRADLELLPLKKLRKADEIRANALVRTVKRIFEDYSSALPEMPRELKLAILSGEDPTFLSEYIPANLHLRFIDKQSILEENSILSRLEMIAQVLEKETQIQNAQNEIYNKVKNRLDRHQREFILREQMKVISGELGEISHSEMQPDINEEDPELLSYENRILSLPASDEVKEKLLSELARLSKAFGNPHEEAVIETYLDTCLALPWGKKTTERTDLKAAEKILEQDHYGLQKIKERILELVAVRKLNPESSGQILCLVGPPGVGKTSVAASVARALKRDFQRIALGGVRDEAEIRGHRKTYIGSMPGRIMNAVKMSHVMNPVILLDEVDKLASDYKGDPSSALLEALDAEQNNSFFDHYLDIPFDLSGVLFITTANDAENIPHALLDRMELINIEGYTRAEKLQIARRHLLKKQLKQNGLARSQVSVTDEALLTIIDSYTREAGVRSLERELASVLRKCAKKAVAGMSARQTVNAAAVKELLGPEKFLPDETFEKSETGIAMGLAWTAGGGEVMPLEVLVLPGTGKIQLTGQLGNVMRESCEAAITFVRGMTDRLKIDQEFYKNCDIHIHAPEGATPKDGPSAGVTISSALVSALTGIPVRPDVAMTGEITLRGRVLAIGGLREKAMAAHRLGIKTVIIPAENLRDLKDVDKEVQADVRFVPVRHISEVLEIALSGSLPGDTPPPSSEKTQKKRRTQVSPPAN